MKTVAPKANNKQVALRFIRHAARLMVTYNTRTYLLQRHLNRIAEAIGLDGLRMNVGYCCVTLFTKEGATLYAYTPEFRINIDLLSQVMHVIDAVCAQKLSVDEGLSKFEAIERTAQKRKWLFIAVLSGASSAAIALLNGGDSSTLIAVGIASAMSAMAQKFLTKKQVTRLALPFFSACLAAIFCSFWIQFGLTSTPSICLMVPALLMIPGPHFVNGLYDIVENNLQTGIARLFLAASIMISTFMGVLVGSHIMFLKVNGSTVLQSTAFGELSLALIAPMAGVISCGIAAFYNAPWRILLISSLYGMVGYAIRYFLLNTGYSLESSTFFACLTVGFFASFSAERLRVAFSAIAFASAMPMMPGLLMFSAIEHATTIASYGKHAKPFLAVNMLAEIFQASLVLGAMVAGLLLGARFARTFAERLEKPFHKIKCAKQGS